MTNLTRVYVGEIIETEGGIRWLIVNEDSNGVLKFIDIKDSSISIDDNWNDFKLVVNPVKRIGHVGQNILEGDDWICHDGRCWPSVFGKGCEGCMYLGKGSTQKRYYRPGDKVWVKGLRKTCEVIKTTLHVSSDELVIAHPYTTLRYPEENIRKDKNIKFSIRFFLKGEKRYYRWEELREVKRKYHTINPEQLDYICSDLCFFGPYSKDSKRCFECQTGKLQREK